MNHIDLRDIVDVQMISCEHHDTEAGFFREILRLQDFSRIQISHSRVLGGVFKGFHGHKSQVQATIFLSGKVNIELIPLAKMAQNDSYSIHAAKKKCSFVIAADQFASGYVMGPFWVHGYTVLSDYTDVIYVNSEFYDLTQEIRITREVLFK